MKEFKNLTSVAFYLWQVYTGRATIGSSYCLQSKAATGECVSWTEASVKMTDAFY